MSMTLKTMTGIAATGAATAGIGIALTSAGHTGYDKKLGQYERGERPNKPNSTRGVSTMIAGSGLAVAVVMGVLMVTKTGKAADRMPGPFGIAAGLGLAAGTFGNDVVHPRG